MDFPQQHAINNTKEELNSLQEKLNHASSIYLEREKHYENSYKEMELKLGRAIASRDQILELRESEANNQQTFIEQLQKTCSQLEKEKIVLMEKIEDEKRKQRNNFQTNEEEVKNALFNDVVVLANDFKTNCNLVTDFKCESHNLITYIEKLFLHISTKHKEVLLKQIRLKYDNNIELNECFEKQAAEFQTKITDLLIEINKKEMQNNILKNDFEMEINKYKNLIKSFEDKFEKSSKDQIELEKRSESTIKKHEDELLATKADILKIKQEKRDLERLIELSEIEKNNLVNSMKDKDNKILDFEKQIMHLVNERNELLEEKKQQDENQRILKTKFENEFYLVDEKLRKMLYTDVMKSEKLKSLLKQYEELSQEKADLKEKILEANFVIENLQRSEHDHLNKNSRSEDKIKSLKSQIENLENKIKSIRNEHSHTENKYKEKIEKDIFTYNKEKKLLQEKCEVFATKIKSHEINEQVLHGKIEELKQDIIKKKEKIDLLENEQTKKDVSIKDYLIEINELQDKLKTFESFLSEKDIFILNLKKERKLITKKLKEKHEKTIDLENQIQLKNSAERDLQSKNTDLEKEMAELKEIYMVLNEECQILLKDKEFLENQLSDGNIAKDKKLANVCEKLSDSKTDVALLKKIIKNQKEADAKAMKVAAESQKQITQQRAEIDCLKSKINWLQDALQISEQERTDLEKKTKQSETNKLDKIEKHLVVSGNVNENLQEKLEKCYKEVAVLHKVLHQVAMKYDDIYARVTTQHMLQNSLRTDYGLKRPNGMLNNFHHIKEMLSSTLENINNNPEFATNLSPLKNSSTPEDNQPVRISSGRSSVSSVTQLHLRGCKNHAKSADKSILDSINTHQISDESSFLNSQKLDDYIKKHDSSVPLSTKHSELSQTNLQSAEKHDFDESSIASSNDKSNMIVSSWLHSGEQPITAGYTWLFSLLSILMYLLISSKYQTGPSNTKVLKETLDKLLKMGHDLEHNNEEMGNLIADDNFSAL